eukprot:6210371-Pleurochrysis_carterae.AAC.1
MPIRDHGALKVAYALDLRLGRPIDYSHRLVANLASLIDHVRDSKSCLHAAATLILLDRQGASTLRPATRHPQNGLHALINALDIDRDPLYAVTPRGRGCTSFALARIKSPHVRPEHVEPSRQMQNGVHALFVSAMVQCYDHRSFSRGLPLLRCRRGRGLGNRR